MALQRDRKASFEVVVYYGDLARWRFRQFFSEPVWHHFERKSGRSVRSLNLTCSDGDYCIQLKGSDSGFILYNHGPDYIEVNDTEWKGKPTVLAMGQFLRISDQRPDEYIDISVI